MDGEQDWAQYVSEICFENYSKWEFICAHPSRTSAFSEDSVGRFIEDVKEAVFLLLFQFLFLPFSDTCLLL